MIIMLHKHYIYIILINHLEHNLCIIPAKRDIYEGGGFGKEVDLCFHVGDFLKEGD